MRRAQNITSILAGFFLCCSLVLVVINPYLNQGCNRALAPRDQKLGVRKRFSFNFIICLYECCMAKLIRVRY